MKLYVAPRAPNQRRVQMFLAEKGITGIEQVALDLNAGEHRSAAFLAKSPFARVPVLELGDGRALGETRAICAYLEGLQPEPNLMGRGFEERAFVEMADRRVEWYLLLGFALAIPIATRLDRFRCQHRAAYTSYPPAGNERDDRSGLQGAQAAALLLLSLLTVSVQSRQSTA